MVIERSQTASSTSSWTVVQVSPESAEDCDDGSLITDPNDDLASSEIEALLVGE